MLYTPRPVLAKVPKVKVPTYLYLITDECKRHQALKRLCTMRLTLLRAIYPVSPVKRYLIRQLLHAPLYA
jgi:hypothetical protein